MCTRFIILVGLLLSGCTADSNLYTAWQWYLGDPGRTHYSTLDQITTDNVDQLEVAWTYNTGDARADNRSEMQSNPIIVDGVLYTTTPGIKLLALDAASGVKLWNSIRMMEHLNYRGILGTEELPIGKMNKEEKLGFL